MCNNLLIREIIPSIIHGPVYMWLVGWLVGKARKLRVAHDDDAETSHTTCPMHTVTLLVLRRHSTRPVDRGAVCPDSDDKQTYQ